VDGELRGPDGSCLFTLRRLLSRFILFFFLPDLRFTEPEWKVAAADASALLPSLMKEGKKEPIEDSRRRAAMPTHTAC